LNLLRTSSPLEIKANVVNGRDSVGDDVVAYELYKKRRSCWQRRKRREELTMFGVGIRSRRGEVRVADEVRDQIGSEKREVNSNCADNTKDDAERVDKDLNFER